MLVSLAPNLLGAAALLAVLTLGTAQLQGELNDSPADCVEYTISRNPYRTVSKYFYSQLRLELSVRPSSSWAVQLRVRAPRSDQSCTFTLTSSATPKRRTNTNGDDHSETISKVSGSCSSWLSNNSTTSDPSPLTTPSNYSNTWTPPSPPLIIPVSFLDLYGWSSMDVILTKDNELVLMSTSLAEVESLVLPSSGLYGQLHAEWVTNERMLTVRHDCYSECTLISGIHYHTTLGDQFFLWRSKDYDSLEYTAFPSTYKNIFQVVEGEPLVNGLQNWVMVLTDAKHKTFNWTIPGSPLWRYLPWAAGHLHAYDDIKNNMLIHVPESSLVTNCHPYQLPCPDDPFHCQAAQLDRGGGGFVDRLLHSWESTLELGILIFMLIIIVVLIFVVCNLKRKLKMYDLDDHQDEVEASHKKGRKPSAISIGKMNQFSRQSEFCDDFSSDQFYEEPTEMRNIEGNNYSDPRVKQGAARGRPRDSDHFYEDPTELRNIEGKNHPDPRVKQGAARGRLRDSELYCNLVGKGAYSNTRK